MRLVGPYVADLTLNVFSKFILALTIQRFLHVRYSWGPGVARGAGCIRYVFILISVVWLPVFLELRLHFLRCEIILRLFDAQTTADHGILK